MVPAELQKVKDRAAALDRRQAEQRQREAQKKAREGFGSKGAAPRRLPPANPPPGFPTPLELQANGASPCPQQPARH